MRYDVVTSRKDKDGKWRNTRIGVAFPQDGDRISIVLDALPISIWEGQVRMTLFPAKEEKQERKIPPTEKRAEMDDEIPF